MRLLPALLLTGLFAGIATAPAAPGPSPVRDGEEARPESAPEDGKSEEGKSEDPAPAPVPPGLAATVGPALKGPDEVDRHGERGAGTGARIPARGTVSAPDRSGAYAPAPPARAGGPDPRSAARAGLGALPPPAASRASPR